MLIANLKKQDNIAEYILYMWQLEDMLRACKLDIDIVQEKIVEQMSDDPEVKKEVRHWYANLISNMKFEGKTEAGHLNMLNEQIMELNFLHGNLLNLMGDEQYKAICQNALPFINEFKTVSDNPNGSEVEICLNGLYAKLMLRFQQKEISEETNEAFTHFANVLGYLSVKYREMREPSPEA